MDLNFLDLSNIAFDGVSSGGGVTANATTLPDGYDVISTVSENFLIGPKVKLVRKDIILNSNVDETTPLDNAILYDSDFSESTFGTQTRYQYTGGFARVSAGINQAILSDVKFTNGKIVGKIVDSTLTGADFSGTDASQATFEEIISGNMTVNENTKLPEETYIRNGYMICKKAVLAGAELSGQDLSNVNLSYGNLTYANLINTSFKGAYLGDVDFDQADMTGVNLEGAKLYDASLFEVISSDVKTDGNTVMPNGYKVEDGVIVKT